MPSGNGCRQPNWQVCSCGPSPISRGSNPRRWSTPRFQPQRRHAPETANLCHHPYAQIGLHSHDFTLEEESEMKRIGQLLALIVVATLLLTACGGPATTAAPEPTQAPEATKAPEATQPPAAKTEITVVIAEDPATLDPQVSEDFNGRTVNDNVYEMLLTRDQDLNIVPDLATEYKQVDDTTWQCKLRQGVKFHNGEPFNADAVVFSVKRIIDPATKSDQVSNFATITGAEKVGDSTVNIITSGPDPILPARMTMLTIIEPKYAQRDPQTFATAPIGTGPYKFVKWDRGVEVVIEANPDYWGGKPSIDIVHLRPIPEVSTRLAALQIGR